MNKISWQTWTASKYSLGFYYRSPENSKCTEKHQSCVSYCLGNSCQMGGKYAFLHLYFTCHSHLWFRNAVNLYKVGAWVFFFCSEDCHPLLDIQSTHSVQYLYKWLEWWNWKHTLQASRQSRDKSLLREKKQSRLEDGLTRKVLEFWKLGYWGFSI